MWPVVFTVTWPGSVAGHLAAVDVCVCVAEQVSGRGEKIGDHGRFLHVFRGEDQEVRKLMFSGVRLTLGREVLENI